MDIIYEVYKATQDRDAWRTRQTLTAIDTNGYCAHGDE